MTFFESFFRLGLAHITDIQGYDHILYVSSLCLGITWHQWRTLLWLVTAFTVGHSLTLALSVLDIIQIPASLVELLIPITILLSVMLAVVRFFKADLKRSSLLVAEAEPTHPESLTRTSTATYALTVVFGLIHGMGFSNYLRSLLAGTDRLVTALLAFNVGLEIGQVFILMIVLGLLALLHTVGLNRRMVFILSALAVALPAMHLVWSRWADV